jgi:outer membrane protein assembly factor BamA
MKKTILWRSLCEPDTLEIVVSVNEFLEENGYPFEEIKPYVQTHPTNLTSSFKIYF